ncbi:MAG: Gfo/Idh/MocA family oxidoreductase [Candidatus Alcyoniella australis]|nr:Gfo/Idh/MocA family oxidoreductase [Candidatus Alcyoniella australis]
MDVERLRIGIIGGGRIADMHAPGYLEHPRAEIYAVCDIDQATAERRADQWGASKTYTDYRALLDDPQVHAVEILTPHDLHCQMVCDAAAAGKQISVQKPMAISIEQCDQMIAAANQHGVALKVFENFVFYPPYLRAKELIEQGEIGEVLSVRLRLGSCGGGWQVPLSSWAWRLNAAQCGKGPTVFDDGNHKFSVAYDLLGPPREVSAWIEYSFGHIDAPAMITWDYAQSRAKGVFDCTMMPNCHVKSRYYAADEHLEVAGTRGSLEVTRWTGQLLDEPPLRLFVDGRSVGFEDLRADWLDSFSDSAKHFVDAVLSGKPMHLCGERGREVLRFSLAAYQSSELKRPVLFQEVR